VKPDMVDCDKTRIPWKRLQKRKESTTYWKPKEK